MNRSIREGADGQADRAAQDLHQAGRGALGRRRGRNARVSGDRARAVRAAQGGHPAPGDRPARVLGPALPPRRADRGRGDQRRGRHQVARREDRADLRRRAVEARRRRRRGREDERGRGVGDRRRLCERDLPRHHAGRREAQHPARGRRRRRRPDRRARPEEHLPLRARLQGHLDRRDELPAHHEQARRQPGEDGHDHPRGVAVRHRHRRHPARSSCPRSASRSST